MKLNLLVLTAIVCGAFSFSAATTNTYSNIDQMSNWTICTACADLSATGAPATYSMTRGQSSPSMDGKSTRFTVGGSRPYSDVLFLKHLGPIGTATHFTFDLYFYMTHPTYAESLEFDINVAYNGRYYMFSNQCSPRSSHTWDTWDGIQNRWVSTGISCPTFPAYTWNHVTIEVERTSKQQLHWIALTYNGQKHYLNRYVNSKWRGYSDGVSIDFQMDGDSHQDTYSVWLDKVNLKYY